MRQNYFLKTILVFLMALFVGGANAEEKTSTLVFTRNCNGSGKADDDVMWAVTSDAAESKYDPSRGIHYGTNNKAVSYLQLTTSDITGTIKSIVVNAAGNSGTTAKIHVTVGGVAFGSEQSLTGSNAPYTFGNGDGGATGQIVVRLEQAKAKKALYVKSIVVTYSTEALGGTQDPQNSFANATENATVGEPYTIQELTTLSDGGRGYESSNAAVASIDNAGNITLHKSGETDITVTTYATGTYREGSASYKLIVAKGTPVLKFASADFHVYKDENAAGPALTKKPDGISVVYSVENSGIATVDENGMVTALAVGQTTVTATSDENEAYRSSSASYTLFVDERLVSGVDIYEMVTDASTLKAGDKLIFVYQNATIEHGRGVPSAMGPKDTSNFKTTAVSFLDGKHTNIIKVEEDRAANVAVMVLGGTAGAWNFHTKDGYLCVPSDKNTLRTTETVDYKATATIKIADNNDAKVTFTKFGRIVKYNNTSITSLFSTYKSANTYPLIKIYRKSENAAIIFANASEEITYGDNYKAQTPEFSGDASTLVYTSSDETKVKFHGSNVIDILAPGTVTITAAVPGNAASGSYELKVNAPSDGHEINLTFGAAGYLTWVATADIDFSQTAGVTAYQITGATAEKVTAEEVAGVPQGAAVLLKGNGTVTLKRTTGVAPLAGNKMLACTDASVTGMTGSETSTDIYVLGNGGSGLGFYMLRNTLQAGKGYFRINGAAGGAKPSFVGFEETTGIGATAADADGDGAYYTLQGIRVTKPQRGVYIRNGKKVIVK